MRWRLLVDPPDAGDVNMAVDETLLESACSDNAVTTVRFYQFERPTLSLGYRQQLEAEELRRLRGLGVSVVRRMTGGRALLHQHELTYSVAAPVGGMFHKRAVKQSYGQIMETIAAGLRRLGASIDEPRDRSTTSTRETAPERVPCLAVPTGHEIYSGGRKLVASAQRWRRRGFLQHGAILYRIDRRLFSRVHDSLEQAALGAVGLLELGPPRIPERAVLPELITAFETLFAAPPTESELTAVELERSRELARKYRRSASPPTR